MKQDPDFADCKPPPEQGRTGIKSNHTAHNSADSADLIDADPARVSSEAVPGERGCIGLHSRVLGSLHLAARGDPRAAVDLATAGEQAAEPTNQQGLTEVFQR